MADKTRGIRIEQGPKRVRAYLVRTGAADADFFAAVDAEADEVGARVRKSCLTMSICWSSAIPSSVFIGWCVCSKAAHRACYARSFRS